MEVSELISPKISYAPISSHFHFSLIFIDSPNAFH